MMLIDLHAHTWPRSHDSRLSPDDLIVRAKAAGLDAIVFTEHDAVWDASSVAELRAKHDFLVLAGIEITMEDDGHMLVFGIDRYVYGARELAEYVRQCDGVMVWAHPYRRQLPRFCRSDEEYEAALQRAARNELYQGVRALETVNGRGSYEENAFSRRLGERMGLPETAGTDSHRLEDVGKCTTYFERPIRNERELVAELQAGRFTAVDLRSGVPVPLRR
jgi:predicted metal-dependent phosphoesterase TrpH